MLKNIKPVKPKLNPPEMPELEDQIVELAMSGKLDDTTNEAIREQVAMGLPITFRRGNQVIKQYSDGREEILATIETVPYKLPAGVEILRKQ